MQIVKVMGGLGNQMFAYAYALALRNRGGEVKLDTTWYERNKAHNGWELGKVFPLEIPLCTLEERDRLGDLSLRFVDRLRRKIFGVKKSHYREPRPGFHSRFLEIRGEGYFEGYWQSPRYHEGIGSEIERVFSFPGGADPRGDALVEASAGRTLIGVHVRRGDYMSSEALYGFCTEVYYRNALKILLEGAKKPLVLFFSEDLAWCEKNLASACDAVFVDWNTGDDSWKDMRLMSLCDRLAIANSSFSWWGSRLGSADKLVVAPSRWFGGDHPDHPDIGLSGWIGQDS